SEAVGTALTVGRHRVADGHNGVSANTYVLTDSRPGSVRAAESSTPEIGATWFLDGAIRLQHCTAGNRLERPKIHACVAVLPAHSRVAGDASRPGPSARRTARDGRRAPGQT